MEQPPKRNKNVDEKVFILVTRELRLLVRNMGYLRIKSGNKSVQGEGDYVATSFMLDLSIGMLMQSFSLCLVIEINFWNLSLI